MNWVRYSPNQLKYGYLGETLSRGVMVVISGTSNGIPVLYKATASHSAPLVCPWLYDNPYDDPSVQSATTVDSGTVVVFASDHGVQFILSEGEYSSVPDWSSITDFPKPLVLNSDGMLTLDGASDDDNGPVVALLMDVRGTDLLVENVIVYSTEAPT